MSTTELQQAGSCKACGQRNAMDNQYCAGCGQPLWEKCNKCSVACRIGQSYCNGCGHDLKADIEKRLLDSRHAIDRAVELAAAGLFSGAIRLLETQLKPSDFRFVDFSNEAKKLLASFSDQALKWEEKLEGLPERCAGLKSERRFKEVVTLLEEIPKGVLSEELSNALEEALHISHITDQAKASLKVALVDKDWQIAIADLSQLLELYPDKQKYNALVTKVSNKIFKNAQKLKQNGRHAEALGELAALPADVRSEQHVALIGELEELVFVRRLVARGRFLWPIIGAGIDRLQQLTPSDSKVVQLAERFSATRKSRPKEGYHAFATWMESDQGLVPSGIVPCTFPTRAAGARPDALMTSGAQFWAAYGLALQGLGEGVPCGNLWQHKRKGMLGLLTRKKRAGEEAAWGLDIGDSRVKAIKLVRREDEVIVEDAIVREMRTSGASRSDLRKVESSAVSRCLAEMKEDGVFGDTPVAASLATGDLLHRHIVLPTKNPKQHETFLRQEAQANIPISLEQLAISYCKFEPVGDAAISQNAVLVAVRSSEMETRRSQFEEVGLELISLCPEPFALFNTLRHLDFLGQIKANDCKSAIALIDVGFCRTNVLVLSRAGCWFRALDWGVDDLTRSLAAKNKLRLVDAEKLRFCPSRGGESITETLTTLNQACAVPRREVARSLNAASEQLGDYKLASALLIGGGAYQSLLASWINGEDL